LGIGHWGLFKIKSLRPADTSTRFARWVQALRLHLGQAKTFRLDRVYGVRHSFSEGGCLPIVCGL